MTYLPSAPSLFGTSAAEEALAALWRARLVKRPVRCTRCAADNVALAIGADQIYRWSCVPCGWVSTWFRMVDGRAQILLTPPARRR